MRPAPDDAFRGPKARQAVVDLLHYYCHTARALKGDGRAIHQNHPRTEARPFGAAGTRPV